MNATNSTPIHAATTTIETLTVMENGLPSLNEKSTKINALTVDHNRLTALYHTRKAKIKLTPPPRENGLPLTGSRTDIKTSRQHNRGDMSQKDIKIRSTHSNRKIE
jgi:hypothetical protein